MKTNSNSQNNSKVFLFFLLSILLIWRNPLSSQERFRKSPPYPEPLPELELPNIESGFLSNGLGISVIHKDNLPVISLRLVILSGESSSPEKLPGMATFVANMLSRGALNLSSSEIEEMIEFIGGNFSSAVFPDYSLFTFTFLEEYLDEALEILGKMILQPSFNRREIENVQRSMFYDLVRKNTDSEFIAKRVLFKLLFKGHSYRKSIYSEDIIKNFNQKSLFAFFDNYYRPNNARIILTGNLNLSTASRKVSRYLNTWKRKNLEVSLPSLPEPNQRLKICFVNLPKTEDTTIYMGNIVPPLTNPDFFPFVVLNQVLGGTPTSHLFMNLRESKGYAYYAFSEVEFFRICGVFYIKAKVRPEVTYASIKESLAEVEKITKEEIPSFEIEQAKSYLIGNFPLRIETFENISLKVSEIKAFNLGEEHWSKYYENIMLISPKKVFEIAQKYPLLTPVVVIVGDQNIIIDHLRDFKEVEVYNKKGILLYYIKRGEE